MFSPEESMPPALSCSLLTNLVLLRLALTEAWDGSWSDVSTWVVLLLGCLKRLGWGITFLRVVFAVLELLQMEASY